MREIKFRAWIYDEYEEQWEMTYDLAFEEYNPVNDQLASVENLMQYTGLKDNNGKEIYEGDIVKVVMRYPEISILGEVKFGVYDHSKNDEYDDERHGWYIDAEWESYCDNTGFELWEAVNVDYYIGTVIGNVFENPELLEVRDETSESHTTAD